VHRPRAHPRRPSSALLLIAQVSRLRPGCARELQASVVAGHEIEPVDERDRGSRSELARDRVIDFVPVSAVVVAVDERLPNHLDRRTLVGAGSGTCQRF